MSFNIYTIGNEQYIASNNSLFQLGEEITTISELQEEQFYLNQDTVGQFELKSQSIPHSSFDAVFEPYSTQSKRHFLKEENMNPLGKQFEKAVKLERVLPDRIAKCPECGSAAGDKNKEDTPICFECGYGTD